jgi:hypothetical protein
MRSLPFVWALCGLACAAPQARPADQAVPTASPSAIRADPEPSALAWPEASRRFRQGGQWLGADGAYSIDLGPSVLWLFADSFIDPAADGSRENGPNFFIHNSVGIQSGPDRARAHDLLRSELSFHWSRAPDGAARSFFQDIDGAQRWLWPLHGARLPDGKLLLFRMQIVPVSGGFGFAVDSWDAVAVDDPELPPERWSPRPVAAGTQTFSKLIGVSVLIHERYLYAYAVENAGQDHGVFLVRWPLLELAGLREGALADPEWFSRGSWQRQSRMGDAPPERLFAEGQNEFSVHYEPERRRFVQVQMLGLFVGDPATQIGLRSSERPEGPWSEPTPFYRPAESALPNAGDLAAYAAKVHPELRDANGDRVLTYVVNDVKHPTPPDSVYYPNIVRLQYR